MPTLTDDRAYYFVAQGTTSIALVLDASLCSVSIRRPDGSTTQAKYYASSTVTGIYAGDCVTIASEQGTTNYTVTNLSANFNTDPLTGMVTGLVGPQGASLYSSGNYGRQLNPNALVVMASPPTITSTDEGQVAWTGSSLATSGRLFSTNNQATDASNVAGNPGAFSIFRASYPTALGTGYPNYFYTKYQTSEELIGNYANHSLQISFLHTGSKFALTLKGATGAVLIKANDQFVSLTPTAVPNDGALRVLIVDFGSSATRRIDLIGFNLSPRGIWIDATDSIEVAPRRGPKVVVLADSFGGGTGNEVSGLLSWITYTAELLGWDDVYSCAAGGTGLIASLSGTKKAYIDRIARDVLPLSPEIVIVQLSINDGAQTAEAALAAAQALYAALKNQCIVIFTSPSLNGGAGVVSANSRKQSNAVKVWCQSAGAYFVDWLEQPLLIGNATPHATTLTSSPAANATSFTTAAALIPGATYKFADGTACYVRSVSGLTATVDRVLAAQTSGTALTQCGACVFTGTGRSGATTGWGNSDLCVSSDGTHPLNLGHLLFAQVAARQIAALRTY